MIDGQMAQIHINDTNVSIIVQKHLTSIISRLQFSQLGCFLTLMLSTQLLPLSINILRPQKSILEHGNHSEQSLHRYRYRQEMIDQEQNCKAS